jgi:hypothetical protein
MATKSTRSTKNTELVFSTKIAQRLRHKNPQVSGFKFQVSAKGGRRPATMTENSKQPSWLLPQEATERSSVRLGGNVHRSVFDVQFSVGGLSAGAMRIERGLGSGDER